MLLSFAPIVLLVFLLFRRFNFSGRCLLRTQPSSATHRVGGRRLVGMYRGLTWAEVKRAWWRHQSGPGTDFDSLGRGGLIGSWMIAGTVPAMIYYGVSILNPSIFFAAAAIICALLR